MLTPVASRALQMFARPAKIDFPTVYAVHPSHLEWLGWTW
jgi:hypothetical protein